MKRWFGVLCCCVLLLGCAWHPMEVKVQGSSVLNPDSQYRSLPVELWIYQLTDRKAFMAASFQQLWHSDVDVLGAAQLSKTVIDINPGEEKILSLDGKTGLKYVGVMGVFREPGERHWRAVKSMKEGVPLLRTSIYVHVAGNHLYVR